MHNLSKKTFIAIEAVLYIACHNSSKPMRSRDICDYMNVTLRYLEQILQQLVADNILKGIRGPKGGYLLARDRRKITVADIYQSLQSIECHDASASSQLQKSVIAPLWSRVENTISQDLKMLSLSDLHDQAQQNNSLPKSTHASADFAI